VKRLVKTVILVNLDKFRQFKTTDKLEESLHKGRICSPLSSNFASSPSTIIQKNCDYFTRLEKIVSLGKIFLPIKFYQRI